MSILWIPQLITVKKVLLLPRELPSELSAKADLPCIYLALYGHCRHANLGKDVFSLDHVLAFADKLEYEEIMELLAPGSPANANERQPSTEETGKPLLGHESPA